MRSTEISRRARNAQSTRTTPSNSISQRSSSSRAPRAVDPRRRPPSTTRSGDASSTAGGAPRHATARPPTTATMRTAEASSSSPPLETWARMLEPSNRYSRPQQRTRIRPALRSTARGVQGAGTSREIPSVDPSRACVPAHESCSTSVGHGVPRRSTNRARNAQHPHGARSTSKTSSGGGSSPTLRTLRDSTVFRSRRLMRSSSMVPPIAANVSPTKTGRTRTCDPS